MSFRGVMLLILAAFAIPSGVLGGITINEGVQQDNLNRHYAKIHPCPEGTEVTVLPGPRNYKGNEDGTDRVICGYHDGEGLSVRGGTETHYSYDGKRLFHGEYPVGGVPHRETFFTASDRAAFQACGGAELLMHNQEDTWYVFPGKCKPWELTPSPHPYSRTVRMPTRS
jgi:hypothetical protein